MMLDAALYVTRLINNARTLRSVRSALSLDYAMTQAPSQSGACFVVPMRDWATGPQGIGVGRTHNAQTGILILVSDADPSGSGSLTRLAEHRTDIESAIERWVPAAGWSPTLWQEGRLAAIGDGRIWWLDIYQTQTGRSITANP